MPKLRVRNSWRQLRVALAVLTIAAVVTLTVWPSAAALDCEGVALDDGCLFTITGGDTPEPEDGYAVTNADGVPLYDFIRERDLNAIGYPISQRWLNGPFTFQAFQKVILQWDPGRKRMNYYNTLDVLANRYPDVELPNVPLHQVLEADRGASFGTIIRNHLALLDQNPAIKERFLSEPDWLNLYGLPIRYEEREAGDHPRGLQMLRAQRTVFVIWNVPAPGTTVGRVNLQNVPDKVKKLSSVIIPNAAKVLRKELDPALRAALASIPWVADGITPVEEAAIAHLDRILLASESLFSYLIESSYNELIRTQPTEATLPGFEALADIADLPWVVDGLSDTENSLVRRLYDTTAEVPALITLLAQKQWIKDGVLEHELDIINDLLEIGRSERSHLKASDPGNSEATLAYHLLRMPFLDTIEQYDAPAVESLRRIGANSRDNLHVIVSHPFVRHGIANHHAKIIAVLWYVMERNPSLLHTMFDASKVSVEERSIVLPHTGPTILAVIRTIPGESSTMSYLEDAVRFAEGFMNRPFPTNYIALHVSEVVEPWGGIFLGSHIAIREGYDDLQHYFSETAERTIYHEVGHYYWHQCPSWICEGAAVYFEMHGQVLGSGAMKDRREKCENTRILDISSGWNECHYFLGAVLFFNLYHSLGDELFFRGFLRLYDSTHGNLSPGNCEDMERGLCHLRFAFVTGASPDAAALAERFIRELYFGGE